MNAYEILNPSIKGMTLEQQIANGINDWVCEDKDGNPHYGRTKQEAIESHNEYWGIK